jgi:DMSO/TMAO reductase YedYZ molybdopterin-dependent catalytic subunit
MRLYTLTPIVLTIVAVSAPLRADEAARVLIEVINEAEKTVSLTAADLAKLPQKEVTAKDHKGEEARYAGVLLADVLKRADVALGANLRGKLLANQLLVEAADQYRVAFSLPEIDPEWTDNVVLLATTRNGAPLDEAHGPLQIVIPSEKRHSRWVKQVVRMTVRADAR